ncbi:MAG: hypothetical protein KF833_15710 [Verrucomicrobiae bacterium]|nr:hypothetical protein [Verrucomicrobiae bacterium]
MPLFAAPEWYEILAALLFFLITGIAQYLQKRSREKRGLDVEPEPEFLDEPPTELRRDPHAGTLSSSPEVPPPPPVESWQEQLRRLLEGEGLRQEPPPPVLEPAAPVPPPVPAPALVPHPATPGRDYPVTGPASTPPVHARTVTTTRGSSARTPRNRSSSTHPHRPAPRVAPPLSPRRPAVGEAPAALVNALFQSPKTVRQAILAATVLNPPKGLE